MHSNVRQSALPFIFPAIEITEDDKIIQNGKELSINEFNGITEANVTDILVLKAIAFQKFFWPVKLWQHLDVITKLKDGTKLKAGGRLTSRIAGISRTSLVRSIREGRNKTANGTIFMLNTEENLEKYKNLPWSST